MKMRAYAYGIGLQFRLDIRSKNLLLTCYLVPMLFFAVMGSIFTALMPETKETLIQSMTVMGVSMGALIGVPPTVCELYGTDIQKVYQANGAPLHFGLLSLGVSAFCHLMIMSAVILAAAPIAFGASLPEHLPAYAGKTALLILASLGVAGVLGLLVKEQAKLTMVCQIAFLPSILLSGILFPANLLPEFLQKAGKIFPAFWGFRFMSERGAGLRNAIPLAGIFVCAVIGWALLLRRRKNR